MRARVLGYAVLPLRLRAPRSTSAPSAESRKVPEVCERCEFPLFTTVWVYGIGRTLTGSSRIRGENEMRAEWGGNNATTPV